MNVSVVIPFYGDNPYRLRALEIIIGYWQREFPGWELLIGRGDSVAAARNEGVRRSSGDVLFFADSDSLCPPEQVRTAAALAASAPGLVFAFDLYHRLSRRTTEAVAAGKEDPFTAPVDWSLASSGSSGAVAISRACFAAAGGYDEGYLGRGYEDQDFVRRCAALWPLRRVAGEMVHLWHGPRRSDDSPEDQPEGEQDRNYERFMALETGAAHLPQGAKQQLLRDYWRRFGPFRFVIETGVWNGSGSCMQFAGEAKYVAVEVNEESARAGRAAGYDVRTGSSEEWLPFLLSSRDGPALFWLDAHLVAEAGEENHSPLLEELRAILAWPHAAGSVVLVDDVRMMGRPGWPSLLDVWNLWPDNNGPEGVWRWDVRDDILRLTPW